MWIFDKLTIRIFTLFLLSLAFFLTLIITMPMLDARNISYLSIKEKESGYQLSTTIESELQKLTKDTFRWWMKVIIILDNIKAPGQSLYIVTPSEQVITSDTTNINIIRNFNELTSDATSPVKKIYDSQEIVGPFPLRFDNEIYALYILQPASDEQSQFVNLVFDHPFLLLALTMLASSPFLLWLSWSLAKPARRLKKAAEQVARGNIQEQPELELFGSSEFKATGKSFNHMIRELKQAQQTQQRLFSDISHELRTPLTRLKLAASLLRRKQGDSKEIERIENESIKLDQMISSLLTLARQQYHSNEIREVYPIDDLFLSVLDNAIFEAEQINKTFVVVTSPTSSLILCYPQALCSALENIIRNAFRYCQQHIEIRFKQTDQHVMIIVDDDGKGVEAENLAKIFQPFYRTDEARDRERGGAGLGLAIVANAIQLDGGTVHAEKSDLGGLRIVITLPLYKNIS